MADNINDINRELEELRRQLGKVREAPFSSSEINKAKEALRGLRSELREMSGDLDYIAKSFQDSVDELSRQNIYLQNAKKSLSGISDISRQLVDFRRGENTLTSKQLSTLRDQARAKFEQLELSIKSGKLNQGERREALNALNNQRVFNDALSRTIQIQEQVNKEVGLLGQGLEGAGKFLEKMGFAGIAKPISDAIAKTKEAKLQYKLNQDAIAQIKDEYSRLGPMDVVRKKELRDQLESYNKQNKELASQTNKYKNIASSLKEQLTLVNLVDYAIEKIVTGYFEVNKAAVEYQRLTGQNAVITAGLNSNLATSAQVLELMADLTRQTGIAAGAIFSASDLGRLAEARNLLGLSSEQVGNLGIRSKLIGKDIRDYEKGIVAGTNNFNKMNGTALSHGAVMQDVLNTSDEIALSLGNSDKAITKAAASARALGLSLDQVDRIADSMLNFEESIGYELEAQLLTNKQINLAKAREYALANDLTGLSGELAKNGASAAEFANMGRLEQESLAKALGMNRGELAKMIMMQETAKNLTKEQRANAMGVSVEQLEQLDIQQKIETSLSKLAQAFAPILDAMLPIVEAVISVVGPIAKVVASLAGGIAPFIKYLGIGYGILKGTQLTLSGILALQTFITAAKSSELGLGLSILSNLGLQNAAEMYKLTLMSGGNTLAAIRAAIEQTILGSIIAQGIGIVKNIAQLGMQLAINLANAAAALATNAALTFGIGVAIAVGAALAGYAAIKAITADDMVSSPAGYGKRTLMGPEGAIALNDKDTVIAGTDLFPNKQSNESKSISTVVNMAPLLQEVQGLRSQMVQLVELVKQGSTINLDGAKIATTVGRNLPRVQTATS